MIRERRSVQLGAVVGLAITGTTVLLVYGLGYRLGIVLAAAGGVGWGAWNAWYTRRNAMRWMSEQLGDIQTNPERIPLNEGTGCSDLDDRFYHLSSLLKGSRRLREQLDELERIILPVSLMGREVKAGSSLNPPRTSGLMRERIEELLDAQSVILESVTRLGRSAEQMARGAVDQTETVSRTTQTVEALSERIDRISLHAGDAAEATDRTRQEAMRGLDQIQEMIGGMDRLRGHVEENARKARRLGERSVEIGAIIELISGISSRTDMLALNATIESVRAGEHGRGFAVVAEEIRKLAERTATATREIGTLVEAIQADTHESMRALNEEQSEMEREAERVREAGSALERISRMADDSARLVDEISRSAAEQVQATRDLVVGIRRISESSRRILAESTNVHDESQRMIIRCTPIKEPRSAERSGFRNDVGATNAGMASRPQVNQQTLVRALEVVR